MRRVTVVALAFIAALAAPVRAACGATCVQPRPVEVARAPAPSCHETAAEPRPAETPVAHCSHDHSVSMRPAAKTGGERLTLQPAALAPVAARPPIARIEPVAPSSGVSRGSPPIVLNPPLRI